MKKHLSVLADQLFGETVEGNPLEVGADAPKISGIAETGNSLNLGDLFQSEGFTFVYFYPKAETCGCSAQADSLRDAQEDLDKAGVTVVGVSMDTVQDQADFKKNHNLHFTLIADTEAHVVSAFGVPRKGNVPARQSFLVKGGKIVWRDLHASTKEQAADVLKVVAADEKTTVSV